MRSCTRQSMVDHSVSVACFCLGECPRLRGLGWSGSTVHLMVGFDYCVCSCGTGWMLGQ